MMKKSTRLTEPYSAYHAAPLPAAEPELTHVEKGSLGGEYLRRFWQPVAMTARAARRAAQGPHISARTWYCSADKSEVGLLDQHCPHRGTSLEFGIAKECGMRCCYHGWKFAPMAASWKPPATRRAAR